jgi:Holliday junction resolvasome RuvABC endonuclease subunit
MSILALDLGTRTGWALADQNGNITSGTASFKHTRYDGGGMRFLRFRSWLDEVYRLTGGFDELFYEQVRRHAGTDASHLYGGWMAILEVWCEQRSIPYQGVPVGTIKRFITGKGNADKAAVIDAVRLRGFAPVDDNEADAIAILLWAIETKGGVR